MDINDSIGRVRAFPWGCAEADGGAVRSRRLCVGLRIDGLRSVIFIGTAHFKYFDWITQRSNVFARSNYMFETCLVEVLLISKPPPREQAPPPPLSGAHRSGPRAPN
ncbi:hypothetical protein EVAR_27847_1 [Eumeta japonica]|uniref:Uncharacterized protein n=1 Tax=Eumeta variegata TaxID=151549 RepID=A0A4C1VJ99_EUMVA|nr:hypothetical protein EVAR_27847_1 [Eumeta japonica]